MILPVSATARPNHPLETGAEDQAITSDYVGDDLMKEFALELDALANAAAEGHLSADKQRSVSALLGSVEELLRDMRRISGEIDATLTACEAR